MRRRYYVEDDDAIVEFVAWAMILTGKGLVDLIKHLTRPGAYTPYAPDDPRQVSGILEHVPKIDWSQVELPKLSAGSKFQPPKLRGWKDLKNAAKNLHEDLKTVQLSWAPGDRPQIIPRSEVGHPFEFPRPIAAARAYRILPARTPPNPQARATLIRSLLSAAPRLTFEITADGRETAWRVVDYEGRYPPQIIVDHLRTHYPGAVVELEDAETLPGRTCPFYRHLLLFGLTNEYAAPLPFWGELKGNDPLATLTRRMDFLDPEREEQVQYQVFSFVSSQEASNRAMKRLVHGSVRPTSGLIRDPQDPLAGFDLKLLNAKLDDPLYHTFVAITIESQSEGRLAEIAQIAHDVLEIRQPRYNGLTLVGSPHLKRAIETETSAMIAWFETLLTAMVKSYQPEWRRLLSVLSSAEIATLWHLPDETYTAEKIVWSQSAVPKAVVADEVNPETHVQIGDVVTAGRTTPVVLPVTSRATHLAIAGKTGTGKSTLLANLIHQDIAAGRGVAVLDPHGHLVETLLTQSIPEARHADVVLLECGRSDYPVPLNPFRIPPGARFASAYNAVYWVMRRIYEDIWLSGQTDMVMRNVIQALLCDPDATPLDIRRLFTNDAYRGEVVSRMQRHEDVALDVIEFWADFGNRSPGDIRELSQPVLNRTGAFLGNRTLELMTCHPAALDFRGFITEKKIVLVNLHGEEIVNEVGSLGAMFLSSFYLASELLGVIPDGAPPRYYLYVDEVERYITSPLKDLFAQARKFGLSLSMANQFLDQLSKDTLAALIGTVGTHCLFEMGLTDSRTFAPLLEPDLPAETLLQLGLYRMVVKTRADAVTLPAFTVSTRPTPSGGVPYPKPPFPPEFVPGQEVRAKIMQRLRPPTPESKRKARTPKKPPAVTDFE
ncbi:MAG: DUF87 domain-containing protein [Chloroflexota bacterium]|jgi:hypothetical protein